VRIDKKYDETVEINFNENYFLQKGMLNELSKVEGDLHVLGILGQDHIAI
jgi:hypothetical protein